MGVSGGEEGALNGPSLMVGGERKAFESLSKILSQIAADNPQGFFLLGSLRDRRGGSLCENGS